MAEKKTKKKAEHPSTTKDCEKCKTKESAVRLEVSSIVKTGDVVVKKLRCPKCGNRTTEK